MTTLRFLPLGFLAASFSLAACGAPPDSRSDSRTSQPEAAPSSSSSSPSSPSKSSDSTTTPAATTGSCAATLASYCAGATCPTDWTAADQVCMNAPSGSLVPQIEISTGCGSSFFALVQSTGTTYFDSTSGALVAVTDESGKCVGGPSDFQIPDAASCVFSACGILSCGGPPDSGM